MNDIEEALKLTKLTGNQVAEITSRYEVFGWPDPDCTCTRKDVDLYDNSGCESCDRQSDHNRGYAHAKYMLDIHGAQDIQALADAWQRHSAEAIVLRAALKNLVDGMMVATGRLRRGYGELHPGIPVYCDSFGHLASEARAALAATTGEK